MDHSPGRDAPGLSLLDHPPARSTADRRRVWVTDVLHALGGHPRAWLAAAADGELSEGRAWVLLSWVEDASSLVVSEKRPELVEAAGFALSLFEADAVRVDLRDAWVVGDLLRLACDLAELGYPALVEAGSRRAGSLGELALPRLLKRQSRLPATFFEEVWGDGPFVFRRRSPGPERWVGWQIAEGDRLAAAAAVGADDGWDEDVDLAGVHETGPSVRGAAVLAGCSLLAAVLATGAVTWLYSRERLPVAGAFVAPLLLALVLALVLLGLAARSHRRTAVIVRRLRPLRARVRGELAAPPGARPTGASDRELVRADVLVDAALRAFADRRPVAGAAVAGHLGRLVAEHWSPEAPLSRRVAAVRRTTLQQARTARRIGRTATFLSTRDAPEDPATVRRWDRWLVRVPVYSLLVWLLVAGVATDDDGLFRRLPAWVPLAFGLAGTALVVAWQRRRDRAGRAVDGDDRGRPAR